MYSKVYWIGCDPDKAPNLMEHYDSVLTPAIQSSEYHVGGCLSVTTTTKQELMRPYQWFKNWLSRWLNNMA
jgi:hypothetical protein